MANSLVIGLYPTKPINGSVFTNYLNQLLITAYEVEFNNPAPSPAGKPTKDVIGSATFTGHPATDNIFQESIIPVGKTLPEPAAAAAAVIPVKPAIFSKYHSPESLINVVLEVQRKGVQLMDRSVNYDVEIDIGPAPTSLTGATVGLYLALTDPSLDPPVTYMAPPSDAKPPAYHDLDAAIKAVLAEDPGGTVNTANLSPDDCLHIARELVSNRTARPLPAPLVGIASPPPTTDLANLYSSDGKGTDEDRAVFEGALQGYYSQLTGDAATMAGYVYAWSMAQQCNALSKNAPNAAITVPVRLKTTSGPGLQAEATVMLGN